MGWIVFTMNVVLAGTGFAVALSARRPRVPSHRLVAIQLEVSVNFRTGTLAGDSTESTWLDRRQKSARSMGAAGCATKD
jgi:hypothetical protein